MSAVINGRLAEVGGWGLYQDTQYTTGARLSISAGVRTKIPNNAGGGVESYLPAGVGSFYNGTTGKITPAKNGDSYSLRINFSSASGSQNNFATIDLDIGGGQGIILQRDITYPKGTNDEVFSSTSLIFTLATFITNGGDLNITPNGDIDIWAVSYTISRISSPS